MNKAELINVIAEKTGVAKKQAEDMVETFVQTVVSTLEQGGEVNLAGFGAFSARRRAGRTGVNPQDPTQKIQIPSVVVPKFKAGKGLKDALKKPQASAAPVAPVAPVAPAPTPVVAPQPKPPVAPAV
jgi:DNA-binding protein HU-beta